MIGLVRSAAVIFYWLIKYEFTIKRGGRKDFDIVNLTANNLRHVPEIRRLSPGAKDPSDSIHTSTDITI